MLYATALTVTALGSTTFAAVLATDAVIEPSTSIAPYVGGGAGAIAVAVLAEVTRRLMNGRLIARETKDIEIELNAAIVAAGQREARLMQTVEASAIREAKLVAAAENLERVAADLRAEMRDLRRSREP